MTELIQMNDLLCALHQGVIQMNQDEVGEIQPHYKEVKYGCQVFGLHNDFHPHLVPDRVCSLKYKCASFFCRISQG